MNQSTHIQVVGTMTLHLSLCSRSRDGAYIGTYVRMYVRMYAHVSVRVHCTCNPSPSNLTSHLHLLRKREVLQCLLASGQVAVMDYKSVKTYIKVYLVYEAALRFVDRPSCNYYVHTHTHNIKFRSV